MFIAATKKSVNDRFDWNYSTALGGKKSVKKNAKTRVMSSVSRSAAAPLKTQTTARSSMHTPQASTHKLVETSVETPIQTLRKVHTLQTVQTVHAIPTVHPVQKIQTVQTVEPVPKAQTAQSQPIASPTRVMKYQASVRPEDVRLVTRTAQSRLVTAIQAIEASSTDSTSSGQGRAISSTSAPQTAPGPTPTAVLVDSTGNKPNGYSKDRALVLGCAIGGIFGLFLCALVVYCILSRYHWKKNRLKNKDEAEVIAEKFAKNRFFSAKKSAANLSAHSTVSDDSSGTLYGYDEEQSIAMGPFRHTLELDAFSPGLAVLARPSIEAPRKAPPPPRPGVAPARALDPMRQASSRLGRVSINTNKDLPFIESSAETQEPQAPALAAGVFDTYIHGPVVLSPAPQNRRILAIPGAPSVSPKSRERPFSGLSFANGSISAKHVGVAGLLRPLLSLKKKPSLSSQESKQSNASTIVPGQESKSDHTDSELTSVDRVRDTSIPSVHLDIRRTSVQSFEDLSFVALDKGDALGLNIYDITAPLRIKKIPEEPGEEPEHPDQAPIEEHDSTDVEVGHEFLVTQDIFDNDRNSAIGSSVVEPSSVDDEQVLSKTPSVAEQAPETQDGDTIDPDSEKTDILHEMTEDLFKDFSGPTSKNISLVFDDNFDRRRSLISRERHISGKSEIQEALAVPSKSRLRRSQTPWLSSKRKADSRMSRLSVRSLQGRTRYSVQAQPSARSLSVRQQAAPPRPPRPLYSPFDYMDPEDLQIPAMAMPGTDEFTQTGPSQSLAPGIRSSRIFNPGSLAPLNEGDTPEVVAAREGLRRISSNTSS